MFRRRKKGICLVYDESFRKKVYKTCETMEKLAYMDSLTGVAEPTLHGDVGCIMLTIRKDEIIAIMVMI